MATRTPRTAAPSNRTDAAPATTPPAGDGSFRARTDPAFALDRVGRLAVYKSAIGAALTRRGWVVLAFAAGIGLLVFLLSLWA
jgi:hypothetical protein